MNSLHPTFSDLSPKKSGLLLPSPLKSRYMKRLYEALIEEHLKEHSEMLFLMGPRQVGKTTTSQSVAKGRPSHYFNWDNLSQRTTLQAGPDAVIESVGLSELSQEPELFVFDEIHKWSLWKDFLKGFYDTYSNRLKFLVTANARLDVFHKAGDSMMGRYFQYRFHPLSVAELLHPEIRESEVLDDPARLDDSAYKALLEFGGFPAPFLKASKQYLNRWKALRHQQLFRGDLQDLTKIQELSQLEVLAELLRFQVGQLTTYDSLARKLRVAWKTVHRWVEHLRAVYYCFLIKPWSKNLSRSLIKEPKVYLYDWTLCDNPGARAENFVASHLLKAVHFWTDHGFGEYDLYYLRDRDKREVDFVVVRNQKPWLIVEVKNGPSKNISPHLSYFQEQTGAEHAFQVSLEKPYVDRNCFEITHPVIVPARTLLSQLV